MLDSIIISLQILNASNEYNCPNLSVIRNRQFYLTVLFSSPSFEWEVVCMINSGLSTHFASWPEWLLGDAYACVRSKFSPLNLPSLHLSLSHKHTHLSFTSPVWLYLLFSTRDPNCSQYCSLFFLLVFPGHWQLTAGVLKVCWYPDLFFNSSFFSCLKEKKAGCVVKKGLYSFKSRRAATEPHLKPIPSPAIPRIHNPEHLNLLPQNAACSGVFVKMLMKCYIFHQF